MLLLATTNLGWRRGDDIGWDFLKQFAIETPFAYIDIISAASSASSLKVHL